MDKQRYHLTIKLYNGEKIEHIVSESTINHLLTVYKNYKKRYRVIQVIKLERNEINIEDIDYFMWHAIMEDK